MLLSEDALRNLSRTPHLHLLPALRHPQMFLPGPNIPTCPHTCCTEASPRPLPLWLLITASQVPCSGTLRELLSVCQSSHPSSEPLYKSPRGLFAPYISI